jgi:hypothetical protein
VAVVAAGVGHEDAEQRHSGAGKRPKLPDVQRPQGADRFGVLETRWESFAIIRGKRHQKVELLFQVENAHAALVEESFPSVPEERPKYKSRDRDVHRAIR